MCKEVIDFSDYDHQLDAWWSDEEEERRDDGVHRQILPMTRRLGGYKASLRGEFRDRTSRLPVPFPMDLGIEKTPAGRRPSIGNERTEGARKLLGFLGLEPGAELMVIARRYIDGRIAKNLHPLQEWVENGNGETRAAYIVFRNAMLGAGVKLPDFQPVPARR